jgi:hypothetical protein
MLSVGMIINGNVVASSQGGEDNAVSSTLRLSNPSGDRETVTESNERSSRSNVEQTLSQSASQGDDDDDSAAHSLSKTIIKDGEEVKVIERTSSEQSSNSKAKVHKDTEFECFACFGGVEIEDEG